MGLDFVSNHLIMRESLIITFFPSLPISELPSDWRAHDEVAQAGASAISASTGTKYTVGSSTNVLYAAAGGSDDYAFGVAQFPVSITMELPAGGTGFNPTTAQILPFVSETWTGIRAMAEKVINKY